MNSRASFSFIRSSVGCLALSGIALGIGCAGGQTRETTGGLAAVVPPKSFRKLPAPQKREITGRGPYRLWLQPYRNAVVSLEGQAAAPRIVRRDKTLALLEFDAPRFRDGRGFRMTVKSEGYRPAYRLIQPEDSGDSAAGGAKLVMLDETKSRHRFLARWSSGEQPKSVTFLDERRVALPLMRDEGVDIIHILTGETRRVAPPRKWARHHGFVETVVLPDRNEFWVSQMYTHAVHVFDLQTLAYKRTIRLKGRWVKVLRYDRSRGRVYASNWNSGDLSVIDVNTHAVTGAIRVGGVPRGMQLSRDGRSLWVAQFGGENDTDGSGRIVEYDLVNDTVVRRFGVPGSKRHIVRAPETFFVSDMSHARVEAYASGAGEFLKYIPVYYKPNTIVLTPDRKWLYVSCRGPNNPVKGYLHKGRKMGRVYVIDARTLEVAEYWEGGNQPTGLAVSPDGRYVVSSDFLDHAIRVHERLEQ